MYCNPYGNFYYVNWNPTYAMFQAVAPAFKSNSAAVISCAHRRSILCDLIASVGLVWFQICACNLGETWKCFRSDSGRKCEVWQLNNQTDSGHESKYSPYTFQLFCHTWKSSHSVFQYWSFFISLFLAGYCITRSALGESALLFCKTQFSQRFWFFCWMCFHKYS